MEKECWLLEFTCHDAFYSEFLNDGLKIVQLHLKRQDINEAKIEALSIWGKILNNDRNPTTKKELKKSLMLDWGHSNPILVSADNNAERYPLVF